jgi:DivIVA domain-containing protein
MFDVLGASGTVHDRRRRTAQAEHRRDMRARSAESLSVYVRQRSFRRVMRGYDPEEVDRHLETISQMVASGAIGEVAREHDDRLADRERAVEASEVEVRERLADAERELHEARVEAEATLKGAQLKAEALTAQAEHEREASAIIAAARSEAERSVAAAQAAAAAELERARTDGVAEVEAAVAARRAELDAELVEYEARRRREADRLAQAARRRGA